MLTLLGTLIAVVFAAWLNNRFMEAKIDALRAEMRQGFEPWHLEPSGTTSDLYGACAGLRDVWVVGQGGIMALRGFEAWKTQPPVSSTTLHGISVCRTITPQSPSASAARSCNARRSSPVPALTVCRQQETSNIFLEFMVVLKHGG